MNCLITGKETNSKTKGFPISREGRALLNDVLEAHNGRISEAFIEANSDKGLTEEALRKLSPKITKHYLLGLLDQKEADVMKTLSEVLEG